MLGTTTHRGLIGGIEMILPSRQVAEDRLGKCSELRGSE